MEQDFSEKVWEVLSEDVQKTTTEICGILNRSHYDVLRILEKFEEQETVLKTTIKNYTYWRKKKDEEK